MWRCGGVECWAAADRSREQYLLRSQGSLWAEDGGTEEGQRVQQKCVSGRPQGTRVHLGEREGHPIDINWVQELQRHSLGALAQRLPAWVAL